MPDNRGLEKWMERIEGKVDNLIETNFTKKDMENFKTDICAPSRKCQDKHEERLQKIEKFQARINGRYAAVATIFGLLIALLGIQHGR